VGQYASSGTYTNCYYNAEISGQTDTGKGDAKTEIEMQSQSTYTDWDFENIWNINSAINNGYPYLNGKLIVTLENSTVSPIQPQYYTGTEIQPEFVVTLDGAALVQGEDYNLAYKDNVKVGTATIKIESANKNNYLEKEITFEIIPKPVSITGLIAEDKIYDANTTVSVSGEAKVEGAIEGEEVSVIPGTYSFVDKKAGINKSIIFSGYTLAGANAGNYTLSAQPKATANITTKPVTITGIIAEDKIYDGKTTTTITGVATINEKIEGDDLTVIYGTAAFEDAEVGTGKIITFSGFSLGGEDANNYELSMQPIIATAAIIAVKEGETPIISQITGGKIFVQATGNSIQISNLPANSKVEVYNLKGTRIYSANP
jgi:hypothetical protein